MVVAWQLLARLLLGKNRAGPSSPRRKGLADVTRYGARGLSTADSDFCAVCRAVWREKRLAKYLFLNITVPCVPCVPCFSNCVPRIMYFVCV